MCKSLTGCLLSYPSCSRPFRQFPPAFPHQSSSSMCVVHFLSSNPRLGFSVWRNSNSIFPPYNRIDELVYFQKYKRDTKKKSKGNRVTVPTEDGALSHKTLQHCRPLQPSSQVATGDILEWRCVVICVTIKISTLKQIQ